MQGEVQVVGALFAVMNGLCYALYLFMTKKLRASSGMEPTDILLWGYIAASAAMPFVLLIMPALVKDPVLTSLKLDLTLASSLYLAGLTLCCTLLPYLLITQSLGKVELSRASLSLLMEPVVAILIGSLVLREPVHIYQVAGGSLILLAVILINLPRETFLGLLGRRPDGAI